MKTFMSMMGAGASAVALCGNMGAQGAHALKMKDSAGRASQHQQALQRAREHKRKITQKQMQMQGLSSEERQRMFRKCQFANGVPVASVDSARMHANSLIPMDGDETIRRDIAALDKHDARLLLNCKLRNFRPVGRHNCIGELVEQKREQEARLDRQIEREFRRNEYNRLSESAKRDLLGAPWRNGAPAGNRSVEEALQAVRNNRQTGRGRPQTSRGFAQQTERVPSRPSTSCGHRQNDSSQMKAVLGDGN